MAAVTYVDYPSTLGKSPKFITDAEVVRQRLELLLKTEPGSMIDSPEYGAGLQRYVYEPMVRVTADFIEMEIRDKIDQFMSQEIALQRLKILTDVDRHAFVVELAVYILEFDKQLVFQIPFDDN